MQPAAAAWHKSHAHLSACLRERRPHEKLRRAVPARGHVLRQHVCGLELARESEVAQLHAAFAPRVVDKHVLRLDVAEHDGAVVKEPARVARPGQSANDALGRARPAARRAQSAGAARPTAATIWRTMLCTKSLGSPPPLSSRTSSRLRGTNSITTYTCDSCGEARSSLRQRFQRSCRVVAPVGARLGL